MLARKRIRLQMGGRSAPLSNLPAGRAAPPLNPRLFFKPSAHAVDYYFECRILRGIHAAHIPCDHVPIQNQPAVNIARPLSASHADIKAGLLDFRCNLQTVGSVADVKFAEFVSLPSTQAQSASRGTKPSPNGQLPEAQLA